MRARVGTAEFSRKTLESAPAHQLRNLKSLRTVRNMSNQRTTDMTDDEREAATSFRGRSSSFAS
jgi:hypothetical protein